MKTRRSLLVTAIALSACTSTGQSGSTGGSVMDQLNKSYQGLKQQVSGVPGDKAPAQSSDLESFDATPLKGIFANAPYDKKTPFDKQYPRVALTIVGAPSNANADWISAQFLKGTGPHGCFQLSAVIWESRAKSTAVPTFTSCFPDADMAHYQGVSLRGATDWAGRAPFFSHVDESTGTKRTDGPVPPDSPIPTGPRDQAFYGLTGFDSGTLVGGMFAHLMLQMDFDWSQSQDRRVWITRIVPAE